jgi:3-methyl-2-oxobutanoate hydroxymethyltransferase
VGVPTIGIGAGPDCDGQVQVISDILGLFTDFIPKHAKQYARLSENMTAAIKNYMDEVTSGVFPTAQHASSIDEQVLKDIKSS